MAFESAIGSKEIVITDANSHVYAPASPIGMSKGRKARDWQKFPYGSPPFKATANPLPKLIPRSEWDERIRDLEQSGRALSKRRRKAGLKSQDQNGTNYCWANGVISASRLKRMWQNEPNVALSAASVAAMIKKGANQGGWGGEALQYIIDNGMCTTATWPENDRNYRGRDTAESRAERALYKVTEWWELQSRNFDLVMTFLLNEVPVPIGLDWWSHEVCAMDGVILSASVANASYEAAKELYKHIPQEQRDPLLERAASRYSVRIWNSWTDDWSDEGEGTLSESKATPDDAVAPSVLTAA